MHVTWGEFDTHADKLRRGLEKLGPDFSAVLCYWCEGRTVRKFEPCNVCGKDRFYGSSLGLMYKDARTPAPESVVNQVLIAAEQ